MDHSRTVFLICVFENTFRGNFLAVRSTDKLVKKELDQHLPSTDLTLVQKYQYTFQRRTQDFTGGGGGGGQSA